MGEGEDAEPDPTFFQPRPSQSDYSVDGTFFSNRGPNPACGPSFYRHQVAAYPALEGTYVPGLPLRSRRRGDHLGLRGRPAHLRGERRIQARRVATQRACRSTRVGHLVDDHTDGRFPGLFGEPGVNVTDLNAALDRGGASMKQRSPATKKKKKKKILNS